MAEYSIQARTEKRGRKTGVLGKNLITLPWGVKEWVELWRSMDGKGFGEEND
ncbi:hypothetical protein M3E13_11350 [Oceanobacillus kimchii]|uniref:hypothetical protein n=1 Tax=Oceanobacillus kimchii TaxID=746691 RepID=UPI00034DA349|nr:hypothetical protein [Oceanobacillus kimchii]MCT1578437.1 hypothetical protein [Oceanobacillus kimchii]MCT2136514.1 hypothetical protein [Oceanobacillus kimchii]